MMRILVPFLFLMLLLPSRAVAAWEDSPDCLAQMGVTRGATREFYRLFAMPGALPEQILVLLDRAKKTIGPSRQACVGSTEQVALDFQLLELRQLEKEVSRNKEKSPVMRAPVSARDR